MLAGIRGPGGAGPCQSSFGFKNLGRRSQGSGVDVAERGGALGFLFVRQRRRALLNVFEIGHVAIAEIVGILQRDDILARELVVRDEVTPQLGLDVEALDRVPGEDVAGGLEGHDVRVVGEDLERDGIAELARLVFVHVELEQLRIGELFPGDGVGAVFLEPRNDVCKLKDEAGGGADRVFVRLQRESAEPEGQPFEGGGGPGLEALRGAKAIGGRPLAVGDVELVGSCGCVRE